MLHPRFPTLRAAVEGSADAPVSRGFGAHGSILPSAQIPKAQSAQPEARLTARIQVAFTRERSSPTPPLRASHQAAEPRKTPRTSAPAPRESAEVPSPD